MDVIDFIRFYNNNKSVKLSADNLSAEHDLKLPDDDGTLTTESMVQNLISNNVSNFVRNVVTLNGDTSIDSNHENKIILLESSSDFEIKFSLNSKPLDIGCIIEFINLEDVRTNIISDNDVNLLYFRKKENKLNLIGQYCAFTALKIKADLWYLSGDIMPEVR